MRNQTTLDLDDTPGLINEIKSKNLMWETHDPGRFLYGWCLYGSTLYVTSDGFSLITNRTGEESIVSAELAVLLLICYRVKHDNHIPLYSHHLLKEAASLTLPELDSRIRALSSNPLILESIL
jgi:hypothetical protein